MPYNRVKGRTYEIPPSPSPSPSGGPSRSGRASPAASSSQVPNPHDITAHLEAQLLSPSSTASTSSRPRSSREDHRPWVRWPLSIFSVLVYAPAAAITEAVMYFGEQTPAIVPAVLVMLFLYVGIPLLIAFDII